MSSSHGLWGSFKSKSKSLQSSLQQLNLKTSSERDGDSPESTLVHKALVKYYKNREPFEGFPDWLGHKEEVTVREQMAQHHPTQSSAKSQDPTDFSLSSSSASSTKDNNRTSTRKRFNFSGGSTMSSATSQQAVPARSQFQGMFDQSNNQSLMNSEEKPQLNQNSAFREEQSGISRVPSSSQLMRDRLKKRAQNNI